MKAKVKQIINNIPLKRKILLIIILGIMIMIITVFWVSQSIEKSYQKLLYDSMSESLSYSSKEINDYMDKMEKLTFMILSNTSVQYALSVIHDEPADSMEIMNAFQAITDYLNEYYGSSSDGIIESMTIYTDQSIGSTNYIRAKSIPDAIQNEMIHRAEEMNGRPCWITDYAKDYGLFLVRSIKRVKSLKLDTIGYVLINFDMDNLISSATEFAHGDEKTAYVLLAQDAIVYYTDNLSKEDAEIVLASNIEQYKVLHMNDWAYFAVHGNLRINELNSYCMVSFEDIDAQIQFGRLINFFIIIVDFLIVLFLSGKLVSSLTRHVSQLIYKMNNFAKDNTKVPEVDYDYSNRNDEFGLLHHRFDTMSSTIVSLIQENYVNEIVKKKAQLKFLETQINPHFLYNTLSSIKYRALASGQQDISDIVDALGGLLRVSLREGEDKDYCLKKEIEVVRSFITIQKLRYGDRLSFSNEIKSGYYSVRMIKFALQPLIENAVRYGLELNVGNCEIILSAEKKVNGIHLFVKNTGSEIESDLLEKLESGELIPQGHGIGLVNIDTRIKMRFGSQYGVKMYNSDDFAVAELFLPFYEEDICV